jgi:hypothetical protein
MEAVDADMQQGARSVARLEDVSSVRGSCGSSGEQRKRRSLSFDSRALGFPLLLEFLVLFFGFDRCALDVCLLRVSGIIEGTHKAERADI